jgi:isochorismate synthase
MISAEDFFKAIETHYQSNLAFVCFSKKKQLKAYLQHSDELYEVEDFKNSGFVFCPFSSDHPKIIFPSDKSDVISSKLSVEKFSFNAKPYQETDHARAKHEDLVQKAISAINSSNLQKIVCSRKTKILAPIKPLEVFQRIGQQYQDAFCYCWYHPKIGMWIGATPEQFVNIERNHLRTVALAGTIDAEKYPKPEWSPKEIEEQQMVTDFIVKALETNAKKLNIGKTETVSAGKLWHLKTAISAEIDPENLTQIISALHPTSAVCGLPKAQAEHFIKANESYDRQYYTGFLGELNVRQEVGRHSRSKNQEQMAIKSIKRVSDLYVNLRCMQVFEDYVEIYVGGGVTKDSHPKAEYEETVAKSQTLLRVL